LEGNYYANYFSELSGLVGVVYGDLGAARVLTCDFAGDFEGGREGFFDSALSGGLWAESQSTRMVIGVTYTTRPR
jgi:hypothetical protein